MKQSRDNGAHSGPFVLRWRAPLVMLSSLIVGVAFAVGHHAFYASLVGTSVSSSPIKLVGWTTTQQQVNVAIGTALAFGFKASLILACSTAYMQLVFGALNTETFKLSQLDNWFGGLNDFWSLLCVGTYWRYPLLTLVALTCWLLPLAAIISPASLSVVFDRIHPSPSRDALAPQPAFDSLALAQYVLSPNEAGKSIGWIGPSDEVSRIAIASATQGIILPIEPPGTNATWQDTIVAPRLACEDTNLDLQREIRDNLIDFYKNITNNMDWDGWTTIMFDYLAWSAYSDDLLPTPFKNDIYNGWTLQDALNSDARDPYNNGRATDIFFAILPRATWELPPSDHGFSLTASYENRTTDPEVKAENQRLLMDWYWEESTMLHCRILPTVYTLNFTYSGPNQAQHIDVLDMKDSVELDSNSTSVQANGPYYSFVSENPSTATVLAGAAVAATRSSSLPARFSTSTSAPTITARSTIPDRPLRLKARYAEWNVDVSNITQLAQHSLRLSSWGAIQQAAMGLFLGASKSQSGNAGRAFIHTGFSGAIGSMSFDTRAFTTALSESRELGQLVGPPPTAEDITNATSGLAFDQAASLLPNVTKSVARPLKVVMEEMYFNITLSMASNKNHQYNPDSPLAPPTTRITEVLYGNVYSYSMDKLWLAYGIAIGISVLNLIVGFAALLRTGASFTDNFSTIIRIARNATIEADLYEEHLPGKDSLPKHMADAELRLRKSDQLLDPKHHGRVTVTERRPSSDLGS
ncbi:hypothetical protein CB0940_02870 [Cercospora beticola]|uniref:Uncharacterized protein n=1 Tax=Cercospora beticola TaxID=122368 RepID=A0A2G5I2G6_CERBT|nr:hypothetical protein CB0940_02870 [Cercospora beticola]PIA98958.1 hypothetical protein CB0940_02870 [Cercospora beticola]WPB00023.1 hypothetical protein RHO25_004642 [Cercospora beticola]CAK1361801.1 unnamed protein product [Cercospora beticola]